MLGSEELAYFSEVKAITEQIKRTFRIKNELAAEAEAQARAEEEARLQEIANSAINAYNEMVPFKGFVGNDSCG